MTTIQPPMHRSAMIVVGTPEQLEKIDDQIKTKAGFPYGLHINGQTSPKYPVDSFRYDFNEETGLAKEVFASGDNIEALGKLKSMNPFGVLMGEMKKHFNEICPKFLGQTYQYNAEDILAAGRRFNPKTFNLVI